MQPCDAIQQDLPQFVADGEPASARYQRLRAHVRRCVRCQQQLQQLTMVEGALRSAPLEPVPAELHTRVARAVSTLPGDVEEAWQPLPWPILVPMVALLAGLAAILMLPPARFLSEGWSSFTMGFMGGWVKDAIMWLESLHDLRHSQVLWAIWSGLFAVCAGLGLLLSLNSWDTQASQGWNELETRVSDAAARVWSLARRAD